MYLGWTLLDAVCSLCAETERVPIQVHGLWEPSCPTQARVGKVQTEASETGWEELIHSCSKIC